MSFNAKASMIINRQLGEPFNLQRSVKQGCPLAPFLFILAADVLEHMLDNPEYGVQGFDLSDGLSLTSQMFADDTTLLLKGNKPNMIKAMNVMDIFCLASRAKITGTKQKQSQLAIDQANGSGGKTSALYGCNRARP